MPSKFGESNRFVSPYRSACEGSAGHQILTGLQVSIKVDNRHLNLTLVTLYSCGFDASGETKMKNIELIATFLLLLGGLNWGLVGIFNYNLVTTLMGDGTMTHILYGLVGAATVWHMMMHMKANQAEKAG